MLSLFVMISLLALLAYFLSERRLIYLLISGAAAGFAQLTKSSSIAILPLIGLLFLIDIFGPGGISWKKRLIAGLRESAVWLIILALVYFVFWPGMWVAPGEMLYQVFGNAFSYAFEGSRLSVTGGVQPAQFQFHIADILTYFRSVLWRTTPIAWLGFLLCLLAAVRQTWRERIVLLSVFLIGLLFILLFAIASGRNSAHYVLTSYVSLDILAAAGFAYSANWLASRFPAARGKALPALILGIAVLLQVGSALPYYPYYYTYYDPIMEAIQPGRQNPSFGYGEGLDSGCILSCSETGRSRIDRRRLLWPWAFFLFLSRERRSS